MLEEIKEALGKGNFEVGYGMSAIVGCSDAEYGCDYSGHTDNELLGIKEISEADVRTLVRRLV